MSGAERDRVFEEWIGAHKAILFKVACAYGTTHADREDLFQEIALQVWHSVDAFRGECAVSTWMYRVALNTAIAWGRREGRHDRGRQDLETAANLLVAPEVRDPRLEWIYGRIAELDDVNRSLALLMLDGFSYRDISPSASPTAGRPSTRSRPGRVSACLRSASVPYG